MRSDGTTTRRLRNNDPAMPMPARHAGKLFNPAFLRNKGIPVSAWPERSFPSERARNAA